MKIKTIELSAGETGFVAGLVFMGIMVAVMYPIAHYFFGLCK